MESCDWSLPTTRTAKRFLRGTQRAHEPEETLSRLLPRLESFGITRVADVTGLDCIGIDTVMVVRPNARSVSVSQGKGSSLAAAKVSGLMESIEQYHAERVAGPLQYCGARELSGRHRIVDTSLLPKFARPFSATDRILWTRGIELLDARETWLPFELVHLDLRLPLPPGSGHFLSGSNGLASGNVEAEAMGHALCELVERDALTLFFDLSAEEQVARRVDLSSIDDPVCQELLDKYRTAGVEVAVWNATSDVGVACFVCWILDADVDGFRQTGLAQGAGCHPDRCIAMARALTEAAQSRLTRVVGSRDDMNSGEIESLVADTPRHRAAMAHRSLSMRFEDVQSDAAPSFEEDLAFITRRLESVGIRSVVVVDLSMQPGLHVVRVVVPGLEPPYYLPGYRPGRRALAARAARSPS